ncbi:MAG: DEAD/DEAH box helicase [Bryobacteraceae bacterium]
MRWDRPRAGRTIGGVFFLADEMGAGKSFQVICAAQSLYARREIHRVIVVAPAAVRSVWFDPELGELRQHLWLDVPNRVFEYHGKVRRWDLGPLGDNRLKWVITNYDYIRRPEHLAGLLAIADRKTWLVLDESSAIKNHKTAQAKACLKLRGKCGRVTLLNGTPITQSPLDMFSQGLVMDPRILDCNFWQFRARYAVLGGWEKKQIVGWINLPDLQKRFAPYVLRRLKEDCLDLPEKLPPIALPAPMTERTWSIYQAMRNDMIAWLETDTLSVASQAIVKIMRLAQVTSGFLGGVVRESLDEEGEIVERPEPIKEVGHEKLDVFLAWWLQQIEQDQNFKCLVWCRFRPETARLLKALETYRVDIGAIQGQQKPAERAAAIRLLDPRTMPAGPVVVVGSPAAGSMGLNLVGAHTVVHMSNDHSLKTRLQADDRVHRPGQRHVVSYFDVVATGPQGQKTIDHTILKALKTREDLARWTTAAWLAELRQLPS